MKYTNKDHNNRVKKISFLTNTDPAIVDAVLSLTFKYIKDKIEAIEVTEDLTEEEFNKKFPVFGYGKMGHFKPDYRRYKAIVNQIKKKRNGEHAQKT